MRNKFFFGMVVGFFVAVVAFVVFLFVSGTARAAVQTISPRVAIGTVKVLDGVGLVEAVDNGGGTLASVVYVQGDGMQAAEDLEVGDRVIKVLV